MKKIILISMLLCSFLSTAQLQFDYLGGMPVNANVDGCFYIDLNTDNTNTGENDVKFVHGNGEIYFEGIYADSARMPATSPRAVNGKFMWADCHETENVYNRSRVYIISDVYHLPIGSHVLYFRYRGMYNFIVVRVDDSENISIRGWRFNMQPDIFECFELHLPIK